MRFSVEVHQKNIPSLVNELLGIVGVDVWQRRFAWLRRELNENEHMQDWLLERCSLESTLMQVISEKELGPASAYRLDLPGRYELAAFAAGISAIQGHLSAPAQNRLRGQLYDGLNTDKGLLSLQHEVSTAVHLMQSGFDLTCHDLESGGGFDYIAARDGLEIEVECKMFSGDIGRRIHKRAQAKLFIRLRARLLQVLGGLRTGLLLRLKFPVRLSSSDSQHAQVCRAVDMGLLSGKGFHSEECSVSTVDFDVAGSPFQSVSERRVDQSKAREFVFALTGNRNPAMALMFTEASQVLVVVFESAKMDDVLGGMRHQLREAAAKQFSGSRPGVFVAQISDLRNEQLLELAGSDSLDRAKASRLQVMTSDLLQSNSRKHVHSVIYRGTPTLASDQGSVSSRGVSYFMRNEFHPLAHDPRFTAFGTTAVAQARVVVAG